MDKLIYQHIGAVKAGGRDLPLREFVRQFRGLSGTAKAKGVCDQFPDIDRLSDFGGRPEATAALLKAMKEATSVPSPDVLGCVGGAHFQGCFEKWYGVKVKRFWYQKAKGQVRGIPFVFEAAVAETQRAGEFFHAVNFSPTFEDPLATTCFQNDKFDAYG